MCVARSSGWRSCTCPAECRGCCVLHARAALGQSAVHCRLQHAGHQASPGMHPANQLWQSGGARHTTLASCCPSPHPPTGQPAPSRQCHVPSASASSAAAAAAAEGRAEEERAVSTPHVLFLAMPASSPTNQQQQHRSPLAAHASAHGRSIHAVHAPTVSCCQALTPPFLRQSILSRPHRRVHAGTASARGQEALQK